MSFAAGADDLRAVANFLDGLTKLSEDTGVCIDHYERVQIKTPSGVTLHLLDQPGVSGGVKYLIEERDES